MAGGGRIGEKYRHVVGMKGAEGVQGSFGGIPHDMRQEAGKIMDAAEEAASQLPSCGPGRRSDLRKRKRGRNGIRL